jgi:hypothetical protein
LVDIPLFHSIAQTSATFVAIIAGFYTTKIIALSNDKRRILQRINELDNELQVKKVYLEGLKKTESDTVNNWDEERIDAVINYVRDDFYVYEQVHSFEELRDWLNEYYGPLTTNQESLLKVRAPAVLEEFENKRNERKERTSLKEATAFALSPPDRPFDAISNEGEINRFHALQAKIRDEEAEILSAQKMKEYDQREYNSVAYPKLIVFGFTSLIIFALLGVIFPLTYGSWISFYESG